MIIIHSESHVHASVNEEQIAYALKQASEQMPDKGVLVATIQLPAHLGTVPCGLYGPVMGDDPVSERDVTYVAREGRAGPSRLVARPFRACSFVTVVAGPHDGHPAVLFTIYGGPSAPREPWDPSIPTPAALAESIAFWDEHALSDQS